MDTHTPAPPPRGRRVARAVFVALGLALTAALATWGLIGPQGESARDGSGEVIVDDESYDYAFRAPDIDPDIERALGLIALAVTLGAAVVAPRTLNAAKSLTARLVPVAMAVGAGVIIGGGGRIMTAPVIGANIGAGLVILFGLPAAALLLIAAGVLAARWANGPRPLP
ncbi:hypothetical protein [Iamia sp.]|uniref:hypothetical protein n=1 Tax=Iamia sp. TaxID=2722710 RepID=UPI002C535208|nr:hypothetical protein [Iamia sp.]HXH59378.1 hypothetical protein [Iamia sp.]